MPQTSTQFTLDDNTRDDQSSPTPTPSFSPTFPALALVWSAAEHHRIGQVLLPNQLGESYTIGKGPPRHDDVHPRLEFITHRPHAHQPVGYIQSPFVSRRQWVIQAPNTQTLLIENRGRRRLMHNGRFDDEIVAEIGDLVAIHNHYLFLVVERRPYLTNTGFRSDHIFGQADALGMVGESPSLWNLRRNLHWGASLPNHILLIGESGSGKEMAAQAIHYHSERNGGPYITIDAGAIPETLFEAEVFGNRRNFPQAGMPESDGLVGMAKGGSLFLDEIGNIPPSTQQKLLRLLDPDATYKRLGDNKISRADIRVIAATNRRLNELKFDIGARLKEQIQVPNLQNRREDIPLLAHALLTQLAKEQPRVAERFFHGGAIHGGPRLSQGLMMGLLEHHYTTNIRELDRLLTLSMRDAPADTLDLTPAVAKALTRPSHSGQKTVLFDLPQAVDLVQLLLDGGLEKHAERLKGQRKYGFQIPELCKASDYPVRARQQVMDHIRISLALALKSAQWDQRRALELLLGQTQDGQAKASHHLDTFLNWCQRKIEQFESDPEALVPWVKHHFRREANHIILVLENLMGQKTG